MKNKRQTGKRGIIAFVAIVVLLSSVLFPTQKANASPQGAGNSGIRVILDNQLITFDVQPEVVNGRLLVPMGQIFEAMGATLEWDDRTKTATAIKGSTTVVTQIGSKTAYINGESKTLDAVPVALNGRTLAPLRFVAEAFGYFSTWDGDTATAYISSTTSDKETLKLTRNVGDIIEFGFYEQDNNTENGTEVITWRVLDVEDGKALIISEKCLDAQAYSDKKSDVTWENCTLRQWLNGEFLYAAFNEKERVKIIATVLQNPDTTTSIGIIDGGGETLDQVFILSPDEVEQYFESELDRITGPSVYADDEGRIYTTDNTCSWRLRAPGQSFEGTKIVRWNGEISSQEFSITFDEIGIRPALWINLNDTTLTR